jgi:hypothetical protein
LGEPLINEVLIPMGMKDRWNRTDPAQDKQFEKFYLHPEPAGLINALFQGTVTPIDVSGRTDLVAILLTGLKLPAGNPTGVTNFTFTGNRRMDLIRLNMAVGPTAAVGAGNTLGVWAGDLAGFPNGRRPYDDVVDIELQILAGVLVPAFNHAPNNQLGDGVDGPDKPFNPAFPWLATPHSGFDHRHDAAPQITHFGAQ